MLFTEGLTVMVTSIIGAGVFALPSFARGLGWFSIFYLLIAFLFSIILARVILKFTPGTVDDEFERIFGKKVAWIPLLLDVVISLLALTAYVVGIQAHLQANPLILLFFMFVPLMFRLHFPASFSLGLAAVTTIFITSLSVVNLRYIDAFPPIGFSPALGGMLLAAAYFAFFGHTIIPRVRAILQHIKKVWKVTLISFSAVFILYSLFTLTTISVGSSELSTLMLSQVYEGNVPSVVALFAALIFYTSFILIGLHLQDRVGHSPRSSLSIAASIIGLYALTGIFGIPFSVIVATAGFAVSIYAIMVGLTALKLLKKKEGTEKAEIVTLLVLSGLPWLLMLFGAFIG